MADSQREINELLAKAAQYRNAAKKALESETKEIMKQKGISEELARIEARKQQSYKEQADALKEVVSQVNELKSTQKENIESLMSQEKGLKSLSGLQASLVEQDRRRIEILASDPKMRDTTKTKLESIASLNQQLLETSAEDAVTRDYLERTIQKELKGLRGLGKAGAELASLEEEKFQKASAVASMTQSQQDRLNAQIGAYDGIKKAVGGVLDTASLLTSNIGFAIGALFAGAGVLADKFAAVNRELGNGFDILNSTTASAGVLGFVFEDTAGTVKALASEFGSTEAATFQTQANIGLMATNMGISNTEAVALSGSFARLNGNSTDIAADMVKTTQEFAKQNGVVPSVLMADLAGSTEEFALFGDEGGENILRAAGFAAKLGTNMKTLSGIAEGLLDFESSITKELELGAMLGKNINLDRARQLALEGDIEGATNATLDALGGIEAFNEMDYFQKKATADLLGVSVAELQKMAQNQENANSLGAVMNEKFSAVGETLNAGLNKYLGTGLKGLGGMITMAGQLGMGFKSLGINMAGVVGKMKNFVVNSAKALANIIKMGAQKIFKGGGKAISSLSGKVTNLASGAGKAGGGVAKGAGAGMKGVGKGMGAGMRGIASGLAAFANPATLIGLAAVTAAIIGIGFALRVAAPGIQAFGEAVGSIVRAVGDAVKTIIGGLGDFFMKVASVATPELALSIIGLAGGFAALTASLATFSVVGLAAIPAMAAVSAFGAVGGLLGLGDEGGEGTTNETPVWVEELKTTFRETKDVYIDGNKVTAAISSTVSKIGNNSYAIT